MDYNNILSQEELEALLTPEELEAFKAEQQSRLEHELMLSPAHLLLAVRELGDTVSRLTGRVQQLEYQLAQKPPIFEPEVLKVVNQVIETALFEMPMMNLEAAQKEIEAEEGLEPGITSVEMSMLLSNDVIVTDTAIDHRIEHQIYPTPTNGEGLLSRTVRHRERKPSLISKLLK
jgi:hypothetical protein